MSNAKPDWGDLQMDSATAADAESVGARRGRFMILACGLLAAALGAVLWFVFRSGEEPLSVESLEDERRQLDETIWVNEALAQQYERPFVRLWDDLRATSDWVGVLGQVPLESLKLGEPQNRKEFPEMDVVQTQYGGDGLVLDAQDWQRLLKDFRDQGYRLVESEWHHSRFERGDPPRSTVAMLLHAVNKQQDKRYIVRSELEVEWTPPTSGEDGKEMPPTPRIIDARKLRVWERQGPPQFSEGRQIELKRDRTGAMVPFFVLAYDLDGDGLSEIILPRENRLYRNLGDFKFKAETLAYKEPPLTALTGVVADFNGDRRADLLCGIGKGYPSLYLADENGGFSSAPRVTQLPKPLEMPQVITAGDANGDGYLDVWIGQYKPPYIDGQMPTPYYDANDGHPGYLLLNDGQGNFRDATIEAGLEAKRFRRTYSAVFVDIDDDDDLDLLTANDFAGLDVFLNDGKGQFSDVSATLVDKRHSFGMSLTFGDYNGDALLDFYMIGMSSTTARRLTQLGLGRDKFPEHQEYRPEMGYGNRMYLAQAGSDGRITGFLQAPFNDQVARTGWSWGVTSFDFDNDGDRDIYVANGHISRKTAEDYCTRFWCHDIYTGTSKEDPVVNDFFRFVHKSELSGRSWNGFEHNCLLVNEGGNEFLSLGFLAGVALEQDSRCVVGDDFDADGRPDLLVLTPNINDGTLQLRLLHNVAEYDRHWIGLRLRESGSGRSPNGARVTLTSDGKTQVVAVVSGDSAMSQHAPTVHFGLGGATEVDHVLVRWPDGSTSRLEHPAIDRYHVLP